MPDIPCGKCESMNIGKNGTVAAGARNITASPVIFKGTPVKKKSDRLTEERPIAETDEIRSSAVSRI